VVWFFFARGLFTALVGLPMALGKIPPNQLYGFRTPRSLSDEAVWYGINRPAGWALFVSGLVGALGALVGLGFADPDAAIWASMAGVCAPLVIGVLYSFVRAGAFMADLGASETGAEVSEAGADRVEQAQEEAASQRAREAARRRERQ